MAGDLHISIDLSKEFFEAAACNDYEELKSMMLIGIKPDVFRNSISIIHLAAMNGDDKLLLFLLEKKMIDINIRSLDLEMTPLHFATINGKVKCVKLLLKFGADVDAASRYDKRPLHFAVLHGNPTIIRLLLSNKANLNVHDQFSHTPLSLAVLDMRNSTLTELLLMFGADPRYKRPLVPPLLCEAVLNFSSDKYLPIMELLLVHGADVNCIDHLGRDALHYAAINGSKTVAKFLCINHCSVSRKDALGRTPVQIGRLHGNQEFVKYLAEYNMVQRSRIEKLQQESELLPIISQQSHYDAYSEFNLKIPFC